jgi:Tfp pilus assembly protein PilN
MPTQQINLLDVLPKKPATFLSFRIALFIVQGWIGFLLLLSIVLFISHLVRASQVENLKEEKIQLTQQYIALTKVVASQNVIQARITRLTDEISLRKKALEIVHSLGKVSLSNFLQDLSKETPTDLWVEFIQFMPQKEFIMIQGNALNPHLVPLFMSGLSANSMLQKQKLSITKISAVKDDYYSFDIQTQKVEAEKIEKTEKTDKTVNTEKAGKDGSAKK